MKSFFMRIKKKISNEDSEYDEFPEEIDESYVELSGEDIEDPKQKLLVKPYVLEDFADVKAIIEDIREGFIIALINIKPLKDKDLVELKRAINKLKKTCDALNGDIAGFGEDWIAVTPSFARIYREKKASQHHLED